MRRSARSTELSTWRHIGRISSLEERLRSNEGRPSDPVALPWLSRPAPPSLARAESILGCGTLSESAFAPGAGRNAARSKAFISSELIATAVPGSGSGEGSDTEKPSSAGCGSVLVRAPARARLAATEPTEGSRALPPSADAL